MLMGGLIWTVFVIWQSHILDGCKNAFLPWAKETFFNNKKELETIKISLQLFQKSKRIIEEISFT